MKNLNLLKAQLRGLSGAFIGMGMQNPAIMEMIEQNNRLQGLVIRLGKLIGDDKAEEEYNRIYSEAINQAESNFDYCSRKLEELITQYTPPPASDPTNEQEPKNG